VDFSKVNSGCQFKTVGRPTHDSQKREDDVEKVTRRMCWTRQRRRRGRRTRMRTGREEGEQEGEEEEEESDVVRELLSKHSVWLGL
jgi:hypothetical protein